MSDRGALAAALEVAPEEMREQETGDGEQGDVAEEATETGETLTPALSQSERESEQGDPNGRLTPPARQDVAERIRQSELLPVGLRTRLAELVLAEGGAAAEQAIRAVEASLPGALRIAAGDVARSEHPGGEVFFHGDADELSEQAAEALARDQLSRSGMLRGQRARE